MTPLYRAKPKPELLLLDKFRVAKRQFSSKDRLVECEAMKKNNSEKKPVEKVLLWMMLTAIHDPKLFANGPSLDLSGNQTVARLCKLGCDEPGLLVVLVCASSLTQFYPQISAVTLRKLARDLREILGKMVRIAPLVLPIAEDLTAVATKCRPSRPAAICTFPCNLRRSCQ